MTGPSVSAKAFIWVSAVILVLMHVVLIINLPELFHDLF